MNFSVPSISLGVLFFFVSELLFKFNLLYFFVSSLLFWVLFLSVSELFRKFNMVYFFVSSLFLWMLRYFVSMLFWKLNMLYFVVSFLFLLVLFFFVYWLFPKQKPVEYDAFVSFSDEDFRHGFYIHLINTFKSKQMNVFVDDRLEREDQIRPSLVRAIEGSSISLIIFSQDYTSSHRCLEQLEKIIECKKKYGQIVFPVFYDVEPTHIQHQLRSYKDAFDEHALFKSAGISRIDSSKFQNDDAMLAEEVVNLMLTRLSKGLVGIEGRIADVESCIRKDSQNTRLIGIYGIDGVGKTTLAKEVFNRLQSEYEGCYFLAHEREDSSKHGILSLEEKMVSKLLGCDVKIDGPNLLPKDIIEKIVCMKVLIVLDNVNDLQRLQKLLENLRKFGSGSRIIVTTRDLQVLKANKVDEEYQLTELSSGEAFELFNMNVFSKSSHQRGYNELSKKVIDYAPRIPLVLKVLAGHLRGKEKKVWESELDKLSKMASPRKNYEVMKLCYNGLDCKEQQIFLDLACFFLRTHEQMNVDYLKSLLKDNESDSPIVYRLERLKDKALITISEDNFVSMHDSLQEMAWEIVREECIKDPRSHNWLWNPHDIVEELKNVKGIEVIRSILLHWPTVKKQNISPHIVAKMSRLQYLEVDELYYCNFVEPFDILGTNACRPKGKKARIVDILAEGLQFLATKLKFLRWGHYPLKSLPENFAAEKLVILKMPCSRMEKLWHGVKNLMNLKEIDLSGSENLKELPDLSKATNLEVLILRGCSMLTSVHPSIFSLYKLEKLDLHKCKSLTILATNSHLHNLSYLNLDYCENLKEFSVTSKNMKELRLGCTKFKALPSSFGNQGVLKLLHLEESGIERLPSSFKNLTQLLHLNASFCEQLQIAELPPFLESLSLQYCTSLQSTPNLPPSLKTLNVEACISLKALPELPPSLETLNVESCSSIHIIPNLPPSLKTLNVSACHSLKTLPELPSSLKALNAEACTSIKTLPELPPSLETLNVESCSSLHTIPTLPLSLKTLTVAACTSLKTLPELPSSLKTLNAEACTSLKTLPELPRSLETLNVESCSSLHIIPNLPPSLKTPNVEACISLKALPNLSPSLETLNVKSRPSLQTIPKLPTFLKTLCAKNCT